MSDCWRCGHLEKPARYVWTTDEDVERRLCVECCAKWRELAQQDTILMPKRIREL